MSTLEPTIVTGDDSILPVTLKKNQNTFLINSGATVKASVISKDKKEILLAPVIVDVNETGSDWGNSLIVVTFDSADTANIPVKELGGALLEIQVDDGGKLTWFHKIKLLQGTIDNPDSVYTPPITNADIIIGLINDELGNQDWQTGGSNFTPSAGDYTTDEITETVNKVFVTPSEKTLISTNVSAISALDSSKADKSNVLELDNTDSFTPLADYHPATKKYVDDNVGGGSEFLDTEFRIVDSTSGYKQIFDTSNLTADRTVTYPDFSFNFEDYFNSDGNINVNELYIKSSSNGIRLGAANQVMIKNESVTRHSFRAGQYIMGSPVILGWSSLNLLSTTTISPVDTTIERKEAGVIGLNGGISYTALSADPSDPADGESVTWVSDGTDSGDAGDVMMKINVGGTIKTTTLVDYSTL